MNAKLGFVATIAGVHGPVGKTEQEAVVRLREYLESYLGKRHFQDTNDEDEQKYQDVLFNLYGRESGENSEEIIERTEEIVVNAMDRELKTCH